MVQILQAILILFTVFWTIGGLLVIKHRRKLFGKDEDHENETSGARSYGIVHLIVIWLSCLWMGIYFCIKIDGL